MSKIPKSKGGKSKSKFPPGAGTLEGYTFSLCLSHMAKIKQAKRKRGT